MDNKSFCQSCGMPMDEYSDMYGTNVDGTKSDEYCSYCFQHGAFTKEETMEEMIETCVPFVKEANPELTEENVRNMLQEFLPTLKRWKM